MIFNLSLTHSLQIQQAKSHLKGWVTIKKQLLIIAALLWLLTTETQRAVVCPMPIQKGITYAAWSAGAYSHPDADLALGHLRATGAEWIGLVVTGYQNNVGATAISINTDVTPTDADLIHAITQAHALGLKVMLKPHVDFSNDTDHWRGEIGTKFTSELQWSAWFDSYRAFIVHYAELAQAYGVDQFAVGTELIGTTQRADDWRAIIAAVRTHYNGPVTYAANHDGEEMQITWWDAVDYIGVDAYYPLTDKNDPTPGELKAAWEPYVAMLASLASTWNKPILVTEIGYTSQDGTNRYPARQQTESALDLQEQADAYQAAFESLYTQPWFAGIFWWVWTTDPFAGGPCDAGHTPREKPAENVLRTWYGGAMQPQPTPIPIPDYSHTLTIYDDAIGAGWEDWSWNASCDLSATGQIYSGTNAISAGLQAWGAFSLHTNDSIDPSRYYWIEFYIRGNFPETQSLGVFFNNADGTELRKRPVDDCRYIEEGTIEVGVWKQVRIPLTDLNAAEPFLAKISIQDRSGQAPTLFWVDEIRLVAAKSLHLLYLPCVMRRR